MREDSKRTLSDEILADTLARSRRRNRMNKATMGGLVILICCAVLSLRQHPSSENMSHDMKPNNPTPNEVEPHDEFDPLLDQLADAGPIIITLPNGDRELILTRP